MAHGNTYAKLTETFAIFAKYGKGEFCTLAEHDSIFSGPAPSEMSKEDRKRIKQLGWTPFEDERWELRV